MAKRKPAVKDESAKYIERSEMDHLSLQDIFGPPDISLDAPWTSGETPEG